MSKNMITTNVEPIFVIAGNFSQYAYFKKCLEEKMYNEGIAYNPTQINYISDVVHLYGRRNIHGYKVGTWYERKDISEIELQLKLIDSFDNFIEIDENFYNV